MDQQTRERVKQSEVTLVVDLENGQNVTRKEDKYKLDINGQ